MPHPACPIHATRSCVLTKAHVHLFRYAVPEIIPLTWQPRQGAPPEDDVPSIPVPDNSLDLVISSCALHWVNNVPGVMREAYRALKPDGVFLAAFLGGETLAELRSAFVAAESERDGGVSPHVSPMMGVADAGNLLAASGFGIPTVDSDVFTVEYPSALSLMEHLQGMGDASASLGARPGARMSTLLAATAAYQQLYANAEGYVPASFEVVYMIGWKPAPSQPAALKRGSVPKGFSTRTSGPGAPAGIEEGVPAATAGGAAACAKGGR